MAYDPLPAYTFIRKPHANTTLHMGETFPLRAEIEAEGPVDSILVRLHPERVGKASLQYLLNVPPSLRSGTGNLKAVVDTSLVLGEFERTGDRYVLEIRTVLSSGKFGGSTVIPLRIEE